MSGPRHSMPTGRRDQDAVLRLIELAYAASEDAGLWDPFLLTPTRSVCTTSTSITWIRTP